MIESIIEQLITAVNDNTAALHKVSAALGSQPTTETPTAVQPEPSDSVATIDDVRDALKSITRDHAKAILHELGANKLPELNASQYAEAIEKAKKVA